MPPQYIRQPSMPAIALPSQLSCALRNFGPGDGIRNERDPSRPALLVRQALETYHELHVLADSVVQVSTRIQNRFALEQSKRAGDDDVTTKPIPPESSEQERAQI